MKLRLPYWLQGGSEKCHACSHTYHYEVERRCVGCDRGVCAHCSIIERETREVWCPDCHEKAGD